MNRFILFSFFAALLCASASAISLYSPEDDSIHFSGSVMHVTWSTSASSSVTVSLYSGTGSSFDALHFTDSNVADSGSYSFTIPASLETSNWYYIYISSNSHSDTVSGGYIEILNSGEQHVVIRNPNKDTAITAGDTLTIQWEYSGYTSSTDIVIEFWDDYMFWSDSYVFTISEHGKLGDNQFQFTFPEWLSSSDDYYVRIGTYNNGFQSQQFNIYSLGGDVTLSQTCTERPELLETSCVHPTDPNKPIISLGFFDIMSIRAYSDRCSQQDTLHQCVSMSYRLTSDSTPIELKFCFPVDILALTECPSCFAADSLQENIMPDIDYNIGSLFGVGGSDAGANQGQEVSYVSFSPVIDDIQINSDTLNPRFDIRFKLEILGVTIMDQVFFNDIEVPIQNWDVCTDLDQSRWCSFDYETCSTSPSPGGSSSSSSSSNDPTSSGSSSGTNNGDTSSSSSNSDTENVNNGDSSSNNIPTSSGFYLCVSGYEFLLVSVTMWILINHIIVLDD